MMAGQA